MGTSYYYNAIGGDANTDTNWVPIGVPSRASGDSVSFGGSSNNIAAACPSSGTVSCAILYTPSCAMNFNLIDFDVGQVVLEGLSGATNYWNASNVDFPNYANVLPVETQYGFDINGNWSDTTYAYGGAYDMDYVIESQGGNWDDTQLNSSTVLIGTSWGAGDSFSGGDAGYTQGVYDGIVQQSYNDAITVSGYVSQILDQANILGYQGTLPSSYVLTIGGGNYTEVDPNYVIASASSWGSNGSQYIGNWDDAQLSPSNVLIGTSWGVADEYSGAVSSSGGGSNTLNYSPSNKIWNRRDLSVQNAD